MRIKLIPQPIAPMKIVRVDVDGVIADLQTPWLRRINEEFGCSVQVDDILGWSMSDYLPKEAQGEACYKHLRDLNLYDEVHPYEEAQEGIELLRNAGWIPVFVTSSTAEGAYGKIRWLREHGFSVSQKHIPDDVIIAHRKSYVLPDTPLVDDGLHNIEQVNRDILIDRPWNRDPESHFISASSIQRATSFEEVLEYLERPERRYTSGASDTEKFRPIPRTLSVL